MWTSWLSGCQRPSSVLQGVSNQTVDAAQHLTTAPGRCSQRALSPCPLSTNRGHDARPVGLGHRGHAPLLLPAPLCWPIPRQQDGDQAKPRPVERLASRSGDSHPGSCLGHCEDQLSRSDRVACTSKTNVSPGWCQQWGDGLSDGVMAAGPAGRERREEPGQPGSARPLLLRPQAELGTWAARQGATTGRCPASQGPQVPSSREF